MPDYLSEDTIVAISTPIGVGAIGIVRMSGPKTKQIVSKIFQSSAKHSTQLRLGWLCDDDTTIDQILVLSFEQPNSYTGEDMAELHCHGSMVVLEQAVELCVRHGARRAEAGEFTKRAFLGGKLSLTQAEAVGELIHAESEQQAKVATNQLAGGLNRQLSSIKSTLVSLAAAETVGLDFGEEDVEDVSDDQYQKTIEGVVTQVELLLAQRRYLPIVRDGIKVAIVGLPNAGKSTLLNALLGYERSIVTELAGTTRDTINEALHYRGIKMQLTDTAGLHETSDHIENIGIERSRQQIDEADIILLLIEPGAEQRTQAYLNSSGLQDLRKSTNTIVVNTKADLTKSSAKVNSQAVLVSASAKLNLTKLLDRIYDVAIDSPSQLDIQVITDRQFKVLDRLAQLLGDIQAGLRQQHPRDVLLTVLQQSIEVVSELDGSSASEAVITEIFRNFCIGK